MSVANDLGKLRAEQFSFYPLLGEGCCNEVEAKCSTPLSYEPAFCFLIKECIPQPMRKPILPNNKNKNIIGKKSVLNLEKSMCVLGSQNNEDIPINAPTQPPHILNGLYNFFILLVILFYLIKLI